jgi:nicotinate-nucleotide--dimethylbenzimidazole phosphoribosyltransferase
VRPFQQAMTAVTAVDQAAAQAARNYLDTLTKPPGSLGELEDIGVRLAAISGQCPPDLPAPAAVAVFAGDHGVTASGVTPWPSEVTRQMVANICAGGAAISVLARHAGATVVVVDVGVAGQLDPAPSLLHRKVRPGTGDIASGDAMSRQEALAALDVGAEVAGELVAGGARCLITGDMGIGSTTPSAALIAHFCGRAAAGVTGRGTGIDDATLARKTDVVAAAVARCAGQQPVGDVTAALACLGGLEIAALAGFIVGGAAARVPVLVDGVIACAGLVTAAAFCPDVTGYCVAGHRSSEPASSVVLDQLGLVPVLNLGLRLGEGTGACLALPVVQAAAHVLREMATFDQAGVTDKDRHRGG